MKLLSVNLAKHIELYQNIKFKIPTIGGKVFF